MNSLADDAELNSPGEILHTDTSQNVVSVNLILKTTRVTELLILTFLGCEKRPRGSDTPLTIGTDIFVGKILDYNFNDNIHRFGKYSVAALSTEIQVIHYAKL